MLSDDSYADRVIQEALAATALGFDLERTAEVVRDCVEAMAKQMKALKEATYPPADYERTARALAHATKSLDAFYRLVEYSRGHPDSRPGSTGADLLRQLTDEQFRIFQGWIEANARQDATG